METKQKKVIAVGVVALILLGTLGVFYRFGATSESGYETGIASYGMILNGSSARSEVNLSAAVASYSNPFIPLIATPVTLYYDEELNFVPLLVADEDSPSRSVTDFLAYYGMPRLTGFGPLKAFSGMDYSLDEHMESGDPVTLSMRVALEYWTSSDGALLIENSPGGYRAAVSVVPLASYLNIPVIVIDRVDAEVADFLDSLSVEYSLVCGAMSGYRKVLHFDDPGDPEHTDLVVDLTTKVVKARAGKDIRYITLANPDDINRPEVLDSVEYEFTGEVVDSGAAAYPGAAPSTSAGDPIHYWDIPADYKYANVKVDLKMDVSREVLGDAGGARIYAYLGVDGDENGVIEPSKEGDVLQFFGGSPAYENMGYSAGNSPLAKNTYAHFYTELPFFNEKKVTHAAQLLARLPTTWGDSYLVKEPGDYMSTYTLEITVEKIDDPIYPLMNDLSTMAPYLTALRGGLLLAKPDFGIYSPELLAYNNCSLPCSEENLLPVVNEEALEVKTELNRVLGVLAGLPTDDPVTDYVALADHYRGFPVDDKMHLAIIADTNMVPWFYYNTRQNEATQGFGMPSDIFYMDIDSAFTAEEAPAEIDGQTNPDFELATGRIDGWDAQDVSALIARTAFYSVIMDRVNGPRNGLDLPQWKTSCMTSIGTEPPVGVAQTAANKLAEMWRQAGFEVHEDKLLRQDESRRQRAAPYYGSSSMIFFCAHGFYYWYVPTAVENVLPGLPPVGAGGAFDVAHVKEMRFGPSVLFGSSCVTGKIDSLQPYNALSQAFLHAGLAAYVGASRMSWGSLVPVPDATSGESLGDLLAVYFYGYMCGYRYDKGGGMTGLSISNVDTGTAMMLAKTDFMEHEGNDMGAYNCDTVEEFNLHGDPAFNPFEPQHGG